ncbi:Fibronectin type III domain protein [Parafrankia sp. EAN1pec]|uniref:COG1470 family protein n=1 Tax=Parafrankia sp. (strain EAN1pec) TaxID=298653 RepID=UPI0000541EC3|nr:Fibronectin type III domain protein [Frankia sp. EAN1pec]
MDPVLVLRDTRLQVRPGDTARTSATVRNAGDLVEQYALDVLGPAAAWAEVIPPTISVVRRGESTVQILFRPPVGPTTPAGTVPFALRCVSRENPDSVAIAEGDLAVGAIHEIVASVTPAVSRGRWSGRWTARFENRGTAPARLRLSASDERRTLGFALAPVELEIPPGESGYAFLKARAAKPALLGALTRQQVRLTYTRETAPDEPVAEGFVDVSFEHVPVLSRAMTTIAGLALVGGAAAVVLLSQSSPKDDTAAPGAAPPAPTTFSAETGDGGVVRLSWSTVPGAKEYGIQKLVGDEDVALDTKRVDGQLNAYDFTGLKGGERTCFRLVAFNDSGASQPSPHACATAGITPEPSPGPTPTGPTPTGPTPTSPTPTPETPNPQPGPGTREPRDAYVVLSVFAKDDQVANDAQKPAQRAGEIGSALGVDVVLADADKSTRLSAQYPGFLVIYADRFVTPEDAGKFCTDMSDKLSTVKAICVAQNN